MHIEEPPIYLAIPLLHQFQILGGESVSQIK